MVVVPVRLIIMIWALKFALIATHLALHVRKWTNQIAYHVIWIQKSRDSTIQK